MCLDRACIGIDVEFEALSSNTTELNLKGCTQIEIELTGDAELVIERMRTISPADGKVCLSAPCGVDFVSNKRIAWGAGSSKTATITRYLVVNKP